MLPMKIMKEKSECLEILNEYALLDGDVDVLLWMEMIEFWPSK